MMSYQKNPPIIKKDGTAVPLGMTITPPMMTTAGQRSKRIIAIVAAAGMMLVVGVVLMQDSGSAYHHLSGSGSIASTAEGLVVATQLSTEEEGEDELAGCLADGEQPGAQVGNCCNSYHLGPMGLYTSCGPDPSCLGKDTLCYPITDTNTHSCTKCCNSWSWYFTGPYCD